MSGISFTWDASFTVLMLHKKSIEFTVSFSVINDINVLFHDNKT